MLLMAAMLWSVFQKFIGKSLIMVIIQLIFIFVAKSYLSNYWLKLLQVTPERQNIANTILVFEKNNFDKACSASGINFKTYSTRQKFFTATMSMMVCIVDPMYNKVQMYSNGITDPSVFTFDQMKRNSKTEATDILAMMKNYAQGMAPKF